MGIWLQKKQQATAQSRLRALPIDEKKARLLHKRLSSARIARRVCVCYFLKQPCMYWECMCVCVCTKPVLGASPTTFEEIVRSRHGVAAFLLMAEPKPTTTTISPTNQPPSHIQTTLTQHIYIYIHIWPLLVEAHNGALLLLLLLSAFVRFSFLVFFFQERAKKKLKRSPLLSLQNGTRRKMGRSTSQGGAFIYL